MTRKTVAAGLVALFIANASFAATIREFDLKTIERLGNELTRVSRTAEHGATTPLRKRARQTGITAVQSRLNTAHGAHYDFEVLNDPDGRGFLVYALAVTNKPGEMFLGGHFRITVSADGSKVERIDELQREIILNKIPPGGQALLIGTVQMYSLIPVETYLYSSNLYHLPIYVGTKDKSYWVVNDGKVHKLTKAEIEGAHTRTEKTR